MKLRVRRTRWSDISRRQSSASSDLLNAVEGVDLAVDLVGQGGSLCHGRGGDDAQVVVLVDVEPSWLATSAKARL
jgi:outer membrane cobalamin receptor